MEFAGVPEDCVVVTPLAASPELYFPGDKEIAARHVAGKYNVKRPFILFISRIEHPGKNHVRLIRAFERLKTRAKIPHQLVMVGNDWLRADEVHRAAAASDCADDLIFTGFTPTEDLPNLYRAADLFAFPSLYEGFGLPVLEAMSCGTPVVCSNLSSIPEVAGQAAVQFDPYDEDAISDAMQRLLANEDLRQNYAERGLKRSREFSWKATAQRTLEVLRSVA